MSISEWTGWVQDHGFALQAKAMVKSVAKEYNDLKKEVEKLKDDIIILKTNNDITMNNLVKAQLTGLEELKKQVQAFKKDLLIEVQKVYKDYSDNQTTLQDNMEKVSYDQSIISDNLETFKEQMKKGQIYTRVYSE